MDFSLSKKSILAYISCFTVYQWSHGGLVMNCMYMYRWVLRVLPSSRWVLRVLYCV